MLPDTTPQGADSRTLKTGSACRTGWDRGTGLQPPCSPLAGSFGEPNWGYLYLTWTSQVQLPTRAVEEPSMLRISRLTDYAFILLTELAQAEDEEVLSGSTLAERTPLPQPTVRKVLKKLAQEGLLESHQGAHGGYALTAPPGEIPVSDVIDAMEGPVSVTLCCDEEETCEIEHECPTSNGWKIVNAAIRSTLDNLTLTDIQDGPDSDRLLAAARSGPGDVQVPASSSPTHAEGSTRRSQS